MKEYQRITGIFPCCRVGLAFAWEGVASEADACANGIRECTGDQLCEAEELKNE